MIDLWVTTLIALAVASDAFSVSLGIGTKSMTLSRVGKISLLVGFFHVAMPLLGLYLGDLLAGYLEELGEILGGGLLIFIGYRMISQYLAEEENEETIDFTKGTGLLIFSVSVSIDALTAGFTLGLAGAASLLTALIFGVVALVMTGFGLFLGQQLQSILRGKGELIGGILIIGIGLYFIVF
ncbi:manganese efflux pump MntP family protein [Natranaerobius thermophilus]|uniref:Putative manganese efflux pump MntP n=1 Tax=Natranaerobius thermophilus (strain ATCC BAA-1301 / DSM 18059 / JW/NM-WN-LF) TaxID=457570 RepID=B2A3N8_NATTJ|nr:manganese efflux pump [Natranaerobius thermophilus]ACB83664.1 protein of unknown function DUF204 [Natranaerobius thermophilus JW/NM-WN-LF]